MTDLVWFQASKEVCHTVYIVELDVPDVNQTVDCILKHLIMRKMKIRV